MIIAQIATIPTRESTLKIAVASMKKQLDEIWVYTNSPTDGWKFRMEGVKSHDDIIFICDDDIEYPADFVATMLKYLKKGMVITCMGKNLKPRPIKSFYRDELNCFKTFEDNLQMEEVEIPGTCAMAFHRSTCPDLDHTFFKVKNCADIWMGIYCKENNIPCFVIPHRGDWLTNLMPLLPPDTVSIFDSLKNDDAEITDLVNTRL